MPQALREWRVEIDLDAALRGQGADPGELRRRRPQIVKATAAAVAEAQTLLSPLVLYRELQVVQHHAGALELDTGRLECGEWLAERLADAQRLVAIVATIGPAVEDRATELFPDDPAYALALSGAGTAAVEALAAHACDRFRRLGATRGLRGSVQCSPGSPQWPAESAQPLVFDLVDPAGEHEGDVRLLPSMLMRPVKSLSLLLGLTTESAGREHECDLCAISSSCRFKDRHRHAGTPG